MDDPRASVETVMQAYPQKPEPLEQQARGSLWQPVVVLLLGLLSTAILWWIGQVAEKRSVRELPQEYAVRALRVDVASSHLWLEEFLAGDPTVEVQRIWDGIDHAFKMLDAVLEGGRVSDRWVVEEPMEESELRRQATHLRVLLVDFRTISLERFQVGEQAGIGTASDQRYDQAFTDILDLSEELTETIAVQVDRSQAQGKVILRAVLLIWVLAVALAVFEMWRRERRRMQAERALRRSESQLRQSQKMEALGRLVGGFAHDINNYLAAIVGSCEIVKLRYKGDEALISRMDTVNDTVQRASALIKRLLAFGRQQTTTLEQVDLNAMVGSMGSMMRRLMGEDVTLEVSLSEDLDPVEGDPSQLEQIMVNLLVNSREAMPEGGRVVVETSNRRLEGDRARSKGLKAGGYVELNVTDTGRGIPPEIKDKIFEPFFTTKEVGEGSGLGLATIYGIVSQFEGAIVVESEVGRGTRVRVFLPRSSGSASFARRRPSKVEAPPAGEGTLLLVEDNEDVRDATAAMLQEMGYRLLVAEDGEQALRLFDQAGDVDLVITDAIMPRMHGAELVEKLRARRPGIPALFISGYTGRTLVRRGQLAGGVRLLQKPFTGADLGRALDKLLGTRDRASESTAINSP